MRRIVNTPLGEISFELVYKRVKNVNLRITRDGVGVSAPKRVPTEYIDSFVISKAEFVFRAIERVGRVKPKDTPKYEEGESFFILGEEYTLRIFTGARPSVKEVGKELHLTVRTGADAAARAKQLEAYRQKRFASICERLLDLQMPPFSARGIDKPPLFFREMRSRFGSCHTKARTVTLAKALAKYPPDSVEYVIAHELCHLIHPNHSKAFYAELSAVMPDWKERREALRAIAQIL